jgi:predicted phosphate transport protein (TIGR00153 family)
MARKNEYNYFNAFVGLSKFSLSSAEILNNTLLNFDSISLPDKIKEMHEIEHSADVAKHEMLNRLLKEFLPPIEREDIISLSQKIDDVTDAVEDVLIRIDIFNVKSIRPEIIEFTKLIVDCCNSIYLALIEFQNYKKSTILHSQIIKVNSLEEEGDTLYYNAVKNLYQKSKDPIELMIWTEILHRLERCCDACEDVADDIQSIVMKNS